MVSYLRTRGGPKVGTWAFWLPASPPQPLRSSVGFSPENLFYGLGTVHCQNRRTETMKTPHAILIGLSLIAAAIFFKNVAVTPANANGQPKGHVHFSCAASTIKKVDCFILIEI